MKQKIEFVAGLLGIFWVPALVLLLIIAPVIVIALSLSSCTMSDIRALSWPGPPLPGGSGKLYSEKIDPKYLHVSDSAPPGLKEFYDPELTQDLNR